MKQQSELRYWAVLAAAFLMGCMGLTGVMYLDYFYLQTGLLREGLPELSSVWLLRSAVIILSLVVIAFSFTYRRRRQAILFGSAGITFEQSSVLGVMCVSSLFLLLLVNKPTVFSTLSLEDGPVEWGSALLLFCSCAVFILTFSKVNSLVHISVFTKWALALLSLVFFVIAMEEISWFQRIIDLETPHAFQGNEQGEFNLHNHATNRVENIYYFGAFLFLVVLPFLGVLFPAIENNRHLGPLIPQPFIALIGTVACAYNFDMWNIIFIQITFFGSLIVMLLLALFSTKNNEWVIVVFTLLLAMTTQAVFLANGDNYSRLWEVTEYKEFFIPLGFFAYSVSVHRKIISPILPSGDR